VARLCGRRTGARQQGSTRRTATRGLSQYVAGMGVQSVCRAARRAHLIVEAVTARGTSIGVMPECAPLWTWRGPDANAGGGETDAVPFEPGQSVLDGLRWIR